MDIDITMDGGGLGGPPNVNDGTPAVKFECGLTNTLAALTPMLNEAPNDTGKCFPKGITLYTSPTSCTDMVAAQARRLAQGLVPFLRCSHHIATNLIYQSQATFFRLPPLFRVTRTTTRWPLALLVAAAPSLVRSPMSRSLPGLTASRCARPLRSMGIHLTIPVHGFPGRPRRPIVATTTG